MTLPEKPHRRDDVIIRDLGEETMLYSAAEEQIHVLNPTAHLIWKLCDGQHSISQIEAALRENFEIESDYNIRADVEETLDTLAQKGLLLTV